MPKIPTFEAKGRITAEPAGVQTGIQVSPTASPAAALADVARVAENYYIKQRDNNEKLKAKEKFYEIKSESDKIMESQKNNSDEFEAVNIYNQQFGEYKKQQLSQIKNKRIRQRLETLIDIDQAENVYNIKKNSFSAFEKNSNQIYNQEQNQFGIQYTLENNPKKKNEIKEKRINSAIEYENIHGMGEAWLLTETQKINADSELFDAEKAITRKDFGGAVEILKQSKSIDVDTVQKKILEIEKESVEFNETNLYTKQFLQGGSLVGVDFKNTTEKKVLKNSENILMANAQKNNLNVEQTFAYVDQSFSSNGELSPTFKDLIETGFNTGSITTFDSPSDIPATLKQAVKVAETADKLGRLNVYTTDEQERFYKNVIVLKQIAGLDDYQAIKQAKNFEMNYDKEILRVANKTRNKTLTDLESEFAKSKSNNIGEVKSYASKLFDIYVANGIDPAQAQKQVIKDLKSSIVEIDDHAYLKRDIDAFKSIGGMTEIKTIKEYILKNKLPEEDPKSFFLRHNGGGQFEIRRDIDISPVYDSDGQPLIFYAKDLYNLSKERELKQKEELKQEVIKEQEIKQKRLIETETIGFGVSGA
jgi:hypothetical protein